MRASTEENIFICSFFSCYFIKTIIVLIFSSSSLFESKITLGDQQKIEGPEPTKKLKDYLLAIHYQFHKENLMTKFL